MLVLNGFNTDYIAACEAVGLAKIFEAYSNEAAGESIMEIGFNPNSGYTYIALENGISICSFMGGSVEYLITDFNTGKEFFFDSFYGAVNKYSNMNEEEIEEEIEEEN